MSKPQSDQPKRPGRPKGKVLTEDVRTRFEPEMLESIDRRRKALGLATRSAYIRYLVVKDCKNER